MLIAEQMFADVHGRHHLIFSYRIPPIYWEHPFSSRANQNLISVFLDQHGIQDFWDYAEVRNWSEVIIPSDREDVAFLIYMAFA